MAGDMRVQRAWVASTLVALVVMHASAEDAGVVHALDREVWPLSHAEALLEIEGPADDQIQRDAKEAHLAMLKAQQTTDDAGVKATQLDNAAQAATKKAMDSGDPEHATNAVAAKQAAASARTDHSQAKSGLSVAKEAADAALKKARDAGVTVDLTNASVQQPAAPAKPAPKVAAKPAPKQQKAPVPPLKVKPQKTLEDKIRDRRAKRLTSQAQKAQQDYTDAKVEKEHADWLFSSKAAKLTQVQTKLAEAKSAQAAAVKEQKAVEDKLMKAHVAQHLAEHDVADAKHSAKLLQQEAFEAKVDEQVAVAQAETGGGDVNLKEAEGKRDEADERARNAKAQVTALHLAAAKAKAAVEAAKEALRQKQEGTEELHALLRKADVRFAGSKYDIDHFETKEVTAVEDRDQAKAEQSNAEKQVDKTHMLAHSLTLKANAAGSEDPNAYAEHMKALILNPDVRKKEAVARVKDMDGFSKEGKPLVAADGSVAEQYKKLYETMPLPDNMQNPILEAEARAQLKDEAEKEATAVVSAPGVAQTAAASMIGP